MAIDPIFELILPATPSSDIDAQLALGGLELNATAYDVDTNVMALGGMGYPAFSLLGDATPTAPA